MDIRNQNEDWFKNDQSEADIKATTQNPSPTLAAFIAHKEYQAA